MGMAEDFASIVRRLATARNILGKHDDGEMLKVAAAIKQGAEEEWDKLLRDAKSAGDPVVYVYMSDGWGAV